MEGKLKKLLEMLRHRKGSKTNICYHKFLDHFRPAYFKRA